MRGMKNIQFPDFPCASLVCKQSNRFLSMFESTILPNQITHRIHDLRPALHRHHLEGGQHGQADVVERADAGVRTLLIMFQLVKDGETS